MVAIDGAAGGVNEALNAGVPGGDEHIDEAGDVSGMGGKRVGERARDRAEGGLVQDEIHAGGDAFAGCQVPDVARDMKAVGPAGWSDRSADLLEVLFRAGGEVVEADDALASAASG